MPQTPPPQSVLAFDMQWASIALLWYDYCLTFPMEQTFSTFLLQLGGYAKGEPVQFDHLLTIFMVTFEASAALLTIVRSYQAFRAGHSSWSLWKDGLSYMIFEEGILYFSIISAFTTATLILIYHAPPGSNTRVLNSLTLPLSGILTARFLLHIRHWKQKRTLGFLPTDAYHVDLGSSVDLSTIEFRNGTSIFSSIVDDFGSDPVARMTNEGPEGFKSLESPSFDPDEPFLSGLSTSKDDTVMGESVGDMSSHRSSSGEFGV
ncbi:hypothetical protein BXZ70DRAFT_1005785 [Cristinia sonorae]|uniref:Uncharacterized protein n=1 Tax=Cristinia sonorae TaxID=1940300 RepID=A0A8K0USK9_9AGAR|nr:hypothetical protein BXZ70DRAFT_1005785 [Cristinia sonorae]